MSGIDQCCSSFSAFDMLILEHSNSIDRIIQYFHYFAFFFLFSFSCQTRGRGVSGNCSLLFVPEAPALVLQSTILLNRFIIPSLVFVYYHYQEY